jgi:6-phosphofructokinase 1
MISLRRVSEGGAYRCTTGLADLEAVANGEKPLPRDYLDASGRRVTEAFRGYVLPLIVGTAAIDIGADGLPVYARLAKHMVAKRTTRAYPV